MGVTKAVQFRHPPIKPLPFRLICSSFFKSLCCSSTYFSSLFFPSKQKHHFSLTVQYLQLSRKPVSMMLANEFGTFLQDWQYTRQINFIKSGEKGKAQFGRYYRKENGCEQIISCAKSDLFLVAGWWRELDQTSQAVASVPTTRCPIDLFSLLQD